MIESRIKTKTIPLKLLRSRLQSLKIKAPILKQSRSPPGTHHLLKSKSQRKDPKKLLWIGGNLQELGLKLRRRLKLRQFLSRALILIRAAPQKSTRGMR